MLSIALIAGFLLLGAVIWALLDRHEKRRAVAGLPSHQGSRLILAVAALLLMIFSGGCSLLVLTFGGSPAENSLVPIVGGVPFVLGLIMWWLSMRRKSG